MDGPNAPVAIIAFVACVVLTTLATTLFLCVRCLLARTAQCIQPGNARPSEALHLLLSLL